MNLSATDHTNTPVVPLVLQAYLVQWLQIATSGTVRLSYVTNGMARKTFLHFKCDRCGDNLNQELKTFEDKINVTIPSELQDWVGKHTHPDWQSYKITYGQANTTLTQPLPKTAPQPKGRKFRD